MTGSSPDPIPVAIVSTSHAEDCALVALHDLTTVASAAGTDYRIIGGHMVRILTLVYAHPTQPRATADADAGITESLAAAGDLHHALTDIGYQPTDGGNHYERALAHGHATIDLLVPSNVAGPGRGSQELGDRVFDHAPGLRFTLNTTPLRVELNAVLSTRETLSCTALIPDLEAAVILKVLATQTRDATKDIDDLATLLEIRHATDNPLSGPWKLADGAAVRSGERCDTARAAHALSGPHIPARLTALLKHHIARPPS